MRYTRRTLLATLGASATALAGCQVAADESSTLSCESADADWPMLGAGPSRASAVAARSLPSEEATARRLFPNDPDPSAGGSMAAVPVVDDGVAYGAGIAVEAREVSGGGPEWVFDTDGNVECGPALGCGGVFVSTLNETIALDRAEGTEQWRADVGVLDAGGPAVHDGVCYVPGGGVVALDAETGEELWDGDATRVSGIAVDDRVYVATHGNSAGSVTALGLATGEELWTATDVGNPYSTPALGPEHVFAVAKPADLYAVSRTDGTVDWHRSLDDIAFAPPAVADGRVVVPAGNGSHVRAFDAATGEPLWRFETGVGHATPVVLDDAVLVAGANTGCFLLDAATGERRWAAASAATNTQPVPVDGRLLYLDGRTSEAYVLDA